MRINTYKGNPESPMKLILPSIFTPEDTEGCGHDEYDFHFLYFTSIVRHIPVCISCYSKKTQCFHLCHSEKPITMEKIKIEATVYDCLSICYKCFDNFIKWRFKIKEDDPLKAQLKKSYKKALTQIKIKYS